MPRRWTPPPPVTWGSAVAPTVACIVAAAAGWTAYDSQGYFFGRVLAGVAVAAYGAFLGNGKVFPRPVGPFLEIVGLVACALASALILIEPPEKLTSIRRVFFVGSQEPEHPDNQYPAWEVALCHVVGFFWAFVHACFFAFRTVYGTLIRKQKRKTA